MLQTAEVPKEASAPGLYLLKSEPDEFSIDDLASRPNQTEPWDGVRNYQARNIMQGMRLGDQCLFYHSNTKHVISHSTPGLRNIPSAALFWPSCDRQQMLFRLLLAGL